MFSRQRLPFISLISFLSLASFLRLYNLTWNSFDNDEAFSWATSHRPLFQLINESFHMQGDPHPPVYWVMLKLWMMIASESEVAIRLLTVFFGIIFVALTFALARKLFSPSAGVAASVFAAFSSYLIWNSQDARMYIPAATFGLAGMVCLVNGLQDFRSFKNFGSLWWVSYFLFTTLSCYTHLGASFLLPVHALIIAYSFITDRKRSIPAIISFAAVCLAFLPFALNVWNNSGVSPIGNRYAPTLDQILHNATLVLWTNYAPFSIALQWFVVLFVGAIFLIGVIFSRRSPLGRLLVASYYLVPPVCLLHRITLCRFSSS
ncbi:MAG: glycosyltransferase family 39 protein [Chloroflexi bacterium]|nr:glycosyltransferase family 39 protein [Chloroflexota bacterium]